MRRISSLLALTVTVAVALSSARTASGAFIELGGNTSLNVTASASLNGSSDGPGSDSDSQTDSGDLSKRDIAVSASATLPIDGELSATTVSNAAAAITGGGDAFTFAGSTDSAIPENCPFGTLTQAVLTIDLAFVVKEGGQALISYDIDINADVRNDQKVTIFVAGESGELINTVFLDSTSGQLDPIGPGSYHALLISGALSTTKGVAGETGSAAFSVSLQGSEGEAPPPAAIPLPSGVGPGALLLAIAAVAAKRRWAAHD